MEQEWNSYNEYSELLLKGLLNKLIIREIMGGGTRSASFVFSDLPSRVGTDWFN